jgi:hypothetical protein
LRKDTELVVAGDDVEPGALEEAKGRGLEILTPAQWLGFELAAGASTIGGLLRDLVGAGFVFDTACNEADGSAEVVTTALLPSGSEPALAGDAPGWPRYPEQAAVLNTLVHAAVSRTAAFLTERERPPVAVRGPGYSATATEPSVWFHPVASSQGHPDLTPLRAVGRERVVPATTLEERCAQLGAARHQLYCFRLNDAPAPDNVRTALVFGGLEKGGAEVSFAAVRVVHT